MRFALQALAFVSALMVGAPVQAQSWQTQVEPGMTRAVTCPRDGSDGSGNFSCFMLECPQGGAARYAIAMAGASFAPKFKAELLVDGQSYPALSFSQIPVDGYFLAHAETQPDRDPALFKALAEGERVEIIVSQGGLKVPYFNLPLDGAAVAIASVAALCPVARPDVTQTAMGTPATNPARYAKPHEIGQRDNGTDLLARRVLGAEIAAMGDEAAKLNVVASLMQGSDRRQMLFTDLCHPTWFGIGGCELFVHVSLKPGEPLTKVADVVGGNAVWIDQTVLVMGWPDLVLQAQRGENPPFIRWRWNGQAYGFVESF
ncbi:MAG: hypothetical protein WBA92_17035 [Pseudorhodobacter sp.]